jgi:thiosulfate/3-mercaptopyruvate sulfurtransferase
MTIKFNRTLISVLGLTLVVTIASAQTPLPTVHSDMLVSTEWLASHLDDPHLVLLQISREQSIWEAGHIPGARFIALSEIAITRNNIPNELPAPDVLEKIFEKAGVSDDSHVIVYTDATVLPATRAWFTLDYLGHGNHTSLLDGGLQKWRSEGRAISKDAPAITVGHFTVFPRPRLVVDMDEVKALSWAATHPPSSLTTVLLDARAPEDFTGARPNAELARFGHIPGALNLFWTTTQVKDSSALLPEIELRKLYEAAGVTPGKPVVTYCNSGMQASQAYFALRYLGYDTRLYDGSLSEWSAAKNTQVDSAPAK